MLDALLSALSPSTLLCIAAGLTGRSQRLETRPISTWRQRAPRLDKVPTVFLLLAC